MTSQETAADRTLAERAVVRITNVIGRRNLSRRGFLGRASLVASALVVDPINFVLKPQSAYATVCGADNDCSNGWSAFCCTIHEGANTCPPGSFAAGWWKVDDSAFCNGAARYYVDCNRLPDASCRCDCADGPCDRRRVCCNVFRYGQCNQHIGGVTEVVCRVVLCTPPWEWDETCTATVRTDNQTRSHSATCLPGPGASPIEIKYQDLGLAGSVLGRQTHPGGDTRDGGRFAIYEHGLIMWSELTGAHEVHGVLSDRYRDLGSQNSDLGYPVSDVEPLKGASDPPAVARFEGGALWLTPDEEVWATLGYIHQRYVVEGGATGWLGFPTGDAEEVAGERLRQHFASGWSIVAIPATGETALLRSEEELLEDEWPGTVEVTRWAGANRYQTAVDVSRATFRDGAPVAYLARGDAFADALASGVPAGLAGGPVLLAGTDRLPEVTLDELRRLDPERVIVLGGEAAVAPAVAEQLTEGLSAEVIRIAGPDRYATAATLSNESFVAGEVDTVWVTTGAEFPDALAAVPGAARAGGPLLLVRADAIPEPVIEELERLAPRRIVLVGGGRAVRGEVEQELETYASEGVLRLAGADRYETAALAVQEAFPEQVEQVVIATGQDFPDALAAGPVAVVRGAPILLVTEDEIPEPTAEQLRRLAPKGIRLVGGTAVISEDVAEQLSRYPASSS